MQYKQLDQTYRDDTIADAIYARELEHYHYDLDRSNYAYMLKTMPKGPFRDQIQKNHDETIIQMDRVERVYAALQSQITDPDAHAAAVERARAKRIRKEAKE